MLYHQAIGTLPHAPGLLSEFPVPTPEAGPGQVVVKTAFIGMTPMAVHMMDFGYYSPKDQPMLFPGTVAGTITEVGEGVKLEVVVSNLAFDVAHLSSQEIVLAEGECVMPLADDFTLEQGATIGSSAVAAFHVLVNELKLDIPLDPWATDEAYVSKDADKPILLLGGSTSTAFYAIQILKAVGFKNIITTSSPGSHARLTTLGATHTLTYSDIESTMDRVLCLLAETANMHVPLIVDCVGDVETLPAVSKVAGEGSKVAVLVPLRKSGHGKTEKLLEDDDIVKVVHWRKGVELVCVKSFSYAQRNLEMGATLQPKVLPAWLKRGALQPSPYKVVEGATQLERMAEALSLLREGKARGEKLLVAF